MIHSALATTDLHVPGYIAASDPGAVGAGICWLDTTLGEASTILKQRNAANTGWNTILAGSTGPTYAAHASPGATLTLDFSAATTHQVGLNANCTFTFTNPTAGGVYVLHLLQDATGSRTVTWPATVKFPGGTTFVLTTTLSKLDIITLSWNGTNYFAVFSGASY